MAIGKWIGGVLGFISGGPLGALAGVALGALFDKGIDAVNTPDSQETTNRSDSYGHSGQRAYSNYQQTSHDGQRNSFMFSLLVLSAYIIRADGKVMHSEMECVRRFLRNNFGSSAEQQGNSILLRLFEEQKRMDSQRPGAFRNAVIQSGNQIAANMNYSQRLQLLNYLTMIAKADGVVSPEEVGALQEVATSMDIQPEDISSMLHLSGNDLNSAYKVLGITPNATDDEVKTAYRRMALKHHPDRVATLGEDVRRAAEKKFQEINEAKERIFKARGL